MFIVWGKFTSQSRRNTQASPSKPILFNRYHLKLLFWEGSCEEIKLSFGISYVRSNFPPQKHLTGDSKRNFCDDFQTPPSIEWMVMFYFQFKNFVLTWLWSSPSFQRRPACEIFINCKTVFGGYFDQKNSFFPNKKSSAINRNVCIQLFYNDNDNTW